LEGRDTTWIYCNIDCWWFDWFWYWNMVCFGV